jgi:CubicO group peptidase (beta-lactamase class C family)
MRTFFVLSLVAALAAPGTASAEPDTVIHHGAFRIEFAGKYQPKFANLDVAVERWMSANGVPAAQLAFRRNGALVFSHAYTYGPPNVYATVKTTSALRLSSVSKMMATAAVANLYARHKLAPDTPVFPLLGITKPLFANERPDPFVDSVTVQQLVDQTGGFHGMGAGDPLFMMRAVEIQLNSEPLSPRQFARWVYGLPLQFKPGSRRLYSNVGNQLLGMVVARVTGMSFYDYMTREVLGATRYGELGPSVFDLRKNPVLAPFDYGGDDIIWESAASASDFETNAESVSDFIHSYNRYGLSAREGDYARSGCVPGVATWAESLTNNVDFALLVNARPCLDYSSDVINTVRTILGASQVRQPRRRWAKLAASAGTSHSTFGSLRNQVR